MPNQRKGQDPTTYLTALAMDVDGLFRMSSYRLLLGSTCAVGAMSMGVHACAWAIFEYDELIEQYSIDCW